jgi:PAS domain S-box-containing protein
MSQFSVEKEIGRLSEEIAGLVQLLDRNEGGGGFLQSGRSRQTLAEARERAKKISSTEEHLSEQVKSLHAVVDSVREAILFLDRSGRILFFNHAAEHLLQLKSSDHTLDGWLRRFRFVDSEARTVLADSDSPMLQVLSGAAFTETPIFLQEKDVAGAKIQALTLTTVTSKQNHNVLLLIVSEVSQAENIVQKLELLNASVQELSEGILVIDENGAFLLLNSAAKRLLMVQHPQGQIVDWMQNTVICMDVAGELLSSEQNPFLRGMAGQKIHDVPMLIRRKDASDQLLIEVTARSIKGKGKSINKVFAFVVSEAKTRVATDNANVEDLKSALDESLLQVTELNRLLQERDEKLIELNWQLKDREVQLQNQIEKGEAQNEQLSQLEAVVQAQLVPFPVDVVSASTDPEIQTESKLRSEEKSLGSGELDLMKQALALKQVTERQHAIRQAINRALADASSFSEIAPILLQEICCAAGWSLGLIWELDDSYQHLRRQDLWQHPKTDVAPMLKWSRGAKFAYGEGLPGQVMEKREPLWQESIPLDDASYEVATHCGFVSSFAFPIFSGSRITSVMQFFNSESQTSDSRMNEVFLEISKQLSVFSEGKRAEEQRAQLHAIVELSDDAIIFLSLAGNITRWNKGAEQLFGQTVDYMRGKPLTAIFDAESAAIVDEHIRAAKRGERRQPSQLSCLSKNGQGFLASVLFAPLLSLDGGISGVSVVAKDVSHQELSQQQERELSAVKTEVAKLSEIEFVARARESQISKLNEQVEAQVSELLEMRKQIESSTLSLSSLECKSKDSDGFKELMLSVMAKEIRGPIESILSMSDKLARTADSVEEFRDYANLIHDSGMLISGFCNDVLELSRLKEQNGALASDDFSLIKCVEQAAESLVCRAQRKKLALLTFITSDVPSMLVGDGRRLTELLTRLTELMVNVTDNGGIMLCGSLDKPADFNASIRVSLTSTGIPSAEAVNIIKELTKPSDTLEEEEMQREFVDAGHIGIRLIKHLARHLNVSLQTDSTGACLLHLTMSFNVSSQAMPLLQIDSHVQNSRILVVDGPAGVARMATSYCADWAVKCDGPMTGTDALDIVRQQALKLTPYDIVIMENVMFGMTCLEFAAAIRESVDTNKTKLILFYPHGEESPEIKEPSLFSRIIRGPIVQSVFLKHISALTAPANLNDIARETAGATTLSFALEQLAMGNSLVPVSPKNFSGGDDVPSRPLTVQGISQNIASISRAAKRTTKQSISNIQALKAVVNENSALTQVADTVATAPVVVTLAEQQLLKKSASDAIEQPAAISVAANGASNGNLNAAVIGNESNVAQVEFFDLERLRRICGDSGTSELVYDFIRTGERVLPGLEEAEARIDMEACRRLATELKKSANSLGAAPIALLCAQIETAAKTQTQDCRSLLSTLQKSFDAFRAWVLPRLSKSN